jgi:quercetin dioxygenase-like cupin family protein
MDDRMPAGKRRISKGEGKVVRILRSKKRWAAATVGVAVIGTLAAAAALGSPGSGNTITTLVTANFDQTLHLNSDRVKFQTKDATDVRIQKIVFAPGAFSGWHHHPGLAMVSVESGAVRVWESDCSSQAYGPGLANGAVFVEIGDAPAQVTSASGATVYAVFVAPSNDPPVTRIEDDPVSCP